MAKGKRLDVLVMELGLLPSREAAQAAIMDGGIVVDGMRLTKPGTHVSPSARVELVPGWGPPRYVSRGGAKLDKALREFDVDPAGRVCIDVGASTGGFTDCLLQHGAERVYCVDVGYGQLAWSLRQNPKVVVRERVNARSLTAELLYEQGARPANLAVMDLSFISVLKVLPACLSVLARPADVICLIKPQFEAGRADVARGGVVKSAAVHARVLRSVMESAKPLGVTARALTFSPIKGPAGNIEFLVHWISGGEDSAVDVDSVVEAAHAELD